MKLERVMAEEWGGGDPVSDSVGSSGKKRRMGSWTVRGCHVQPVRTEKSDFSMLKQFQKCSEDTVLVYVGGAITIREV